MGGYEKVTVKCGHHRLWQLGREHLNGVEGFWSYAKQRLYQYRGVPKKFFYGYLAETSFRFNHRGEDSFPLIYRLLKRTDASRLR